MAPRKRPRTSHSKTGCLTCKHRKVKCSEERPKCERCIRGGFVCHGYVDPPKAWFFYSTSNSKADTKQVSIYPESLARQSDQTSLVSSHFGIPLPRGSSDTFDTYAIRIPSLRNGSTDPFDAYAVPIGPSEHSLLRMYSTVLLPILYRSRPANMAHPLAEIEKRTFMGCLQDEAAAYALLSREAALKGLLCLKEGYTAPSVLSLNYMVKSQTALRRRLSDMNGTESPDVVYHILCTISYLAAAEVMAASPTANLHVRALRQLIAKYSELAGPQLLQKASNNVIAVILIDSIRAYLGSTAPTLHLEDWWPYLGDFSREEKTPSSVDTDDSGLEVDRVHEAVENETQRSIIIKQRELLRIYHEAVQANLSHMQILLVSMKLHREVLQANQLLHIAAEAENHLLKAGLIPQEVQGQCARIFISTSILLWSQLILPTSIVFNALFDLAPITLRRQRRAISRSQLAEKEILAVGKDHKATRFWALSIGVYAELNRKESLGAYTACGVWFLETFRDEAKSMDVRSWQQAVSIFGQFLYSDQIKPEIFRWWDQVMSPQADAGTMTKYWRA